MISFIITAKNEPYLQKTIDDLRENALHDIEVLAQEDTGKGQRATLNELAKRAKYPIVAKVDAHCSFAPDFDDHLLKAFKSDMILAPVCYPLDGKTWTLNHHNPHTGFAFNTQMAVEHVGGIGESMAMQGSFFMLTKKNWFDWNVCDESIGSWGHQGCELGTAAYKNGGRCYITDETFYGHVFRHTEDDFPYKRDLKEIDRTHARFIERFKNKDIAGLIEKFDYPCDWDRQKVESLVV